MDMNEYERKPQEYQIGEQIEMPKQQFEALEFVKNDWVVTAVNEEVVFIVQHFYNKDGKWSGANHTGIFKKDIDYSKR